MSSKSFDFFIFGYISLGAATYLVMKEKVESHLALTYFVLMALGMILVFKAGRHSQLNPSTERKAP